MLDGIVIAIERSWGTVILVDCNFRRILLISLFTENQLSLLLANNQTNAEIQDIVPVAYLRIPSLGYRFLIARIDPDNSNLVEALCSYDTIFKVEQIDLQQLAQLAKDNGDNLIAKANFEAKHPLAIYKEVSEAFCAPLFDDSNEVFIEYYNRLHPENLKV